MLIEFGKYVFNPFQISNRSIYFIPSFLIKKLAIFDIPKLFLLNLSLTSKLQTSSFWKNISFLENENNCDEQMHLKTLNHLSVATNLLSFSLFMPNINYCIIYFKSNVSGTFLTLHLITNNSYIDILNFLVVFVISIMQLYLVKSIQYTQIISSG